MTVDEPISLTPVQLLSQLQKSQASQNENLLEILGVVKSTKVSKSPLSAIVRGLYTKNSNLLSTLDKSITEFETGTASDREIIKNFMNEFILSLDNNGILLIQKYATQLKTSQDTEATSFDSKSLHGPLDNLTEYISFIDSSSEFLRNPFVLDRLKEIKNELQGIMNDYKHYTETKKLSAIQFNKVRAFGSKKHNNAKEFVSSYFTVEQIVERSLNSDLYIQNGTNKEKIELLLLDLAGTGSYNSLAILSIDVENKVEKSRSLLYAPFRINEVSLVQSTNSFKLKSIDFSLGDDTQNNIIIISCDDHQLLNTWMTKLSAIFPLEVSNSPIKEKFLLDSQSQPKMFGLGIDLVTDNDHKSALASQESLALNKQPVLKPPFQELYSPDASPLGLGPPKILQQRQRINSGSSVKSQYDKSLPLIKKTLSDNSIVDDEDDKFFQIVNRNTVGVCSDDNNRPISSCGQVVHLDSSQSELCTTDDAISCSSIDLTDSETPNHYRSPFASSVPNLGVHQKSKLYEVSTGSAIDISNFGKKYKPSFEVKSESESPVAIPKKNKPRRKSFFSIFKKSSMSNIPESVPGFDTVESPTRDKFPSNSKSMPSLTRTKVAVEDTIDTSEIPVETEPEKTATRPVSTLPAPFALPSSTSVYFFKNQLSNGSAVNVGQSTKNEVTPQPETDETDLNIPQELKDTINNESTVDYYITNNTPKSMKISKWKEKYGKWEMLTICEKLFVKISVNYSMGKGWLIVFKEEFNDVHNEEIEKPVLILEIGPSITDTRRSAASDLEINSVNAITSEKILINIRCTTGALINGLHSNLNNVILDLSQNVSARTYGTIKASTFSDSTISSSVMDNPSKSSTMTSLSSIGVKSRSGSPKVGQPNSTVAATNSINDLEIYNSCIINNPGSLKVPGIPSMTVRLQKQLHSYAKINVPSSWKIVSMYDLKIDRVTDDLTQCNYFHISLYKEDSGEHEYGWLINENSKFEYLEKIGKAGLLVKVSEQEMYMIECKGKREIKNAEIKMQLTLILSLIFLQCLVNCFKTTDFSTNSDSQNIETVKVVGNKFFLSESGDQFFIKGISYQKTRQEGEIYDNSKEPHYIDPLANPYTCLRDLDYLKELGVNVVRVYQILPTANHDVCMNAFADAGIYVLADLSEPYTSIRRDFPHWDTGLVLRYKEVIDSMHKYDNVLGFFAGNEVTNSRINTDASPFVRAAIRDSKKYIEEQDYRQIPIGYASNDDASIREHLANYFVCDLDGSGDGKADFFAINVYEWCGYSTYSTSGYRDLTSTFADYPVPAFFSEYGCNAISPRPFTEVEALYGSTMSKVWSGGIVYEYFEEVNHYGIVIDKTDGQIVKLPDFDTLKLRFNSVSPVGITIDEANSPPKLPCTRPDDIWNVAHTLPFTPDEGKCECLQESLSCVIQKNRAFDEEQVLKELCEEVDCEPVLANGKTGKYGQFSDCDSRTRASYVLNKYYEQTGRKEETCLFYGRGEMVNPTGFVDLNTKFSSDGRNCLSLLNPESKESNNNYNKSPPSRVSPTKENSTTAKMDSSASTNQGFSKCFIVVMMLIISPLFF
ncbi:13-beta-glucanosyltransferase PGA5 [Spathaspora sp. JA1]|nr:13-beta-glucanosyltransferase PGA5 [Spathaspora sp. JA1]